MSAIIYWLAIRLYVFAVRIASLFNPKAKLFVKGRKGLLSTIKYALVDERRPRIWMHCASLGEFEQGRPVLEELRDLYPNYALVVTFFSPSGYEVRKNYDGADYIFYLPIDSPSNAKRFIAAVQPKVCLFVKYELWYYYLTQLAQLDISVLLISAIFRKDQAFFKRYGKLHRSMLHCFSHIFVQDPASLQLLNRIGVEHVSIGGDTRFDRVCKAFDNVEPLEIASSFVGDNKIIVAGSTWAEDEVLIADVLTQLPNNWKLIIAPHEVSESHIKDVVRLFGEKAVTWTNWQNSDKSKRVLIVDKIGLLLRLYNYADVAWVGGAFKTGLHNTLEAAVYGLPIIHGPVYRKFKEATDLVDMGVSTPVNTVDEALQLINNWAVDESSYEQACSAAKNYVSTHTGATRVVLNYLEEKKLLTVS